MIVIVIGEAMVVAAEPAAAARAAMSDAALRTATGYTWDYATDLMEQTLQRLAKR